ncbi:MAG TPA: hypothetical protein V6D00_07200 [Pantanalinema sp.]
MTNASKKALFALTLSVTAVAGCAKSPSQTPAPVAPTDTAKVVDIDHVKNAGGEILQTPVCPQPGLWNADCRFIAFTACRQEKIGQVVKDKKYYSPYKDASGNIGYQESAGGTYEEYTDGNGHKQYRQVLKVRSAGGLFLWDEAICDVYILNGALAGLNSDATGINDTNKQVQGPGSCSELEQLNPYAFADGKVLFSWGHEVYYWDMVAEARVTVAFDGQSDRFGGPRAVVTADGLLLAYVSNKGTVVLKETDGAYFTKTRELTKIAAEANALFNDGYKGYGNRGVIYDLGISGDGRWMVVNIDGLLYLYDVINPHLFQLLPLSGEALAGQPDRIGHVAINFDGRFVAFTVGKIPVDYQYEPGRYDSRLLVLDRQSGLIDTVPYANLGDTISGADHRSKAVILDPVFCLDGRSLLFETSVGGNFRIWKYDMLTETLRGMVILNSVLGSLGTDVLVSDPVLDP